MFKKDNGALLVIWKCLNDDLIGEVYNNGIEKRGNWNMRARFSVHHNEATEYRVCEYFGFPFGNAWWRRWA